MTSFTIKRLGGVLGAEILGLDPARPLDGEGAAALRKALAEHQVLVLSAPEMTPDQHRAFARHFGTLEVHNFFPNLGPSYEDVSVLDSAAGTRADNWHADETFLEYPLKATFTHAKILPDVGGDTCFASMTAAYEALSPPMKRYLEGLHAVHDCARTTELALQWGVVDTARYAEAIAANKRQAQPMVITHPVTGKKSLFVNETYTRHIVGVSPDESAALLRYLCAHATQVRFQYRHRWRPGDLLVWDNVYTQHHAVFDFQGRRCMYRVSVLGDQTLQPA